MTRMISLKNLNSHQIKTHVNSSFSNVAKIRPFRCIQVDFLQNSAMKKSRDYHFFFLKRYFFVESNVIFTLKFRENSVFRNSFLRYFFGISNSENSFIFQFRDVHDDKKAFGNFPIIPP